MNAWVALILMIVVCLGIGLGIGSLLPTEHYEDGHKYKLIGLSDWVHDPDCNCK